MCIRDSIWKANKVIVDALRDNGALLAYFPLVHLSLIHI